MSEFTPEQLKEILAMHKKWIESGHKKGERAELRGADLRWKNLSWDNLIRADLSWAKLRSVKLRDAYLTRTDLTGLTSSKPISAGVNLPGLISARPTSTVPILSMPISQKLISQAQTFFILKRMAGRLEESNAHMFIFPQRVLVQKIEKRVDSILKKVSLRLNTRKCQRLSLC